MISNGMNFTIKSYHSFAKIFLRYFVIDLLDKILVIPIRRYILVSYTLSDCIIYQLLDY